MGLQEVHDLDLERDKPRAAKDDALHHAPGRATSSQTLHSSQAPVASGIVMRKGDGAPGANAERAIARASASEGHALPDDLRAKFEGSLGTDLSSVRVHTGGESQAGAASVGARAYAVGDDVHFGAGEYDPGSEPGQHLIAHEVAHTVQQRGGSPERQHKLRVSQASDGFEVEADRAADAMVRGAPFSLGGASIGLARKDTAKPAAETSDDKKPEAAKPEYPSWKDGELAIPLGPLGSLKYKASDGTQSTSLAGKASAKGELFKKEYSQSLQLFPLVVATIKGTVSADLTATASASAQGTWSRKDGEAQDSLTLGVSGKGEVAFSASGSLQVTAGAGVANIVSLEGGVKGEITATAKSWLSLGGAITKAPSGTEAGSVTLGGGISADLETAASIVAEVIKPGDDVTLYERQLGKIILGRAGVTVTALYTGNGVVTQPPPVTYAEWLPLPEQDARPRRPLTDEEKQKYVYKGEVENGASGASAGMDQAPDDVAMNDQEIYDEGRKLAAEMIHKQIGKVLPVADPGGGRGIEMPKATGRAVKVNVSGSEVMGLALYPKPWAKEDAKKGRKLRAVKSGLFDGEWSVIGSPSVDMMKTCAKRPLAVAREMLAKYVDITVIAAEVVWDQLPPEAPPRPFEPIETCKNDERAPSVSQR